MSRTLERAQVRGLERVIASQVAPVGTFTVRRSLPAQKPRKSCCWAVPRPKGPSSFMDRS